MTEKPPTTESNTTSRVRPTFEPIPDDLIHLPHPHTSRKFIIERSRMVRWNFVFLTNTTFNTYVPHGWGYTVYRAVFGTDTDCRFAEGLRRLEDWLRWKVRMNRYNDEDEQLWRKFPDCMPTPGEHDATDDMVERMWNEIIEDYPDRTQNVTGPEGAEDFSPVGRAFLSWVESLNVDTSGRNPRYDHCLIIDDTALKMLEMLPAETPAVEPRESRSPERTELENLLHETWVWILDRDAMEEREAGDMQEYPPWARIQLEFLYYLWFMRPKGLIPPSWQGLVEEDKVKWQDIRWWNPHARTFNEVSRAHRARKLADA